MKAFVLDGFNESDGVQAVTVAAVKEELAGRGWEMKVVVPRELDVAPCTGCFGCWTRQPGMCVQDDDIHAVCAEVIESDLLMIVSPLSFGGYSSAAKAILDRSIGLMSPFFMLVQGEVHHKPRYDRAPALAALGVNHGDCERCPEIFSTLLYRNAVNFHAPALAVDIAGIRDLSNGRLKTRIAGLLDQVTSLPMSDLPDRRVARNEWAAGSDPWSMSAQTRDGRKQALVLTGSPKGRSTSSSIGDELEVRLRERGWQTGALRILPSLKTDDSWRKLIDEMNKADLVALVTPLYVDSLPAPVTQALERIAQSRGGVSDTGKQGFMAIFNCGFPESFHNYTGLAIARRFAEEAGFVWMGGLALGMGGAIDGRPLAECGRMVRNVQKALKLTADAIDRGDKIPPEAVDLMAKPFLPRWLYIVMGNRGWKRRAKKHGVKGDLYARPYLERSGRGKEWE